MSLVSPLYPISRLFVNCYVYDIISTEENAIFVTREQQDAYSKNGVIDL
jgi:hypothetical protein